MEIYKKETFDQLIRKSNIFDEKKYNSDKRWKLLEHLYNKNYLNNTNKTIQIPKKIHHIWLGSDLPAKYKEYIESWKKYHPTWKHYLWSDKDIKDLNLFNIKLYNKSKNFGQKSDILRYEILYRFGGIYIDTDFECLKPFDNLLNLEFFTGIAYPSDIEMYIGLIASKPRTQILRNCLKNMKNISDRDPYKVMETTGNYYFTKCFLNSINYETKGVVAFPMDFFYPFPNSTRDYEFGETRLKYIKECSYAIHHWGVSWI